MGSPHLPGARRPCIRRFRPRNVPARQHFSPFPPAPDAGARR